MKDNARLRARYDALWTKCLRLRYEIAAQRCLLALDRMADVVAKANFNPNQPRVPAGSPEGGEWTGTGAGGGGSSGGSGRGGGSGSGGGPSDPSANKVPDSPLKVWPVPGFGKLNPGNPATREGQGPFGTPRNHGAGKHTGIDIQAPVGTPVVAAGNGKVVDLKPNPSTTYGKQVVIDHGNGVFTQSAHLNTVTVRPGDVVQAGQVIGTVGRTGEKIPPLARTHLHFEVRIGKPVPRTAGGTVRNPFDYLPPPP